MTRLLILIFALNTLLAPMGVAAMMPFGADNAMSQESKHSVVINTATTASHCAKMPSHSTCNIDNMSNDLCKEKCATSCTVSPAHIASFSFNFPFRLHNSIPEIAFTPFHSRSISPELRPPLV
jgi:hypothetical protein